MKIHPLYDRVLIQRVEEESTSPGGIFLPDSAKEKPTRAKVKAVGKGKLLEDGKLRALEVKIGDVVLIGKYAGTEVKMNGEDYVVVREEDIMALVEEK